MKAIAKNNVPEKSALFTPNNLEFQNIRTRKKGTKKEYGWLTFRKNTVSKKMSQKQLPTFGL